MSEAFQDKERMGKALLHRERNPNMSELGKVCEHGRLERQCNECDLQSQLAEVKQELQATTKERDHLKGCAKVNSDEHKQYEDSLRKNRDFWKSRCEKLAGALQLIKECRADIQCPRCQILANEALAFIGKKEEK